MVSRKYREDRSFSLKKYSTTIMNIVEDYTRTWTKVDNFEIDIISEWVKSIWSFAKTKISK